MFLALASSVAALAAAPVHSAQIGHGADAYIASYHARSSVTLRDVTPRFPARESVAVCRWQANLTVDRAVESGGRPVAAFGKAVHSFAPLSGSYAGGCNTARSQIDAEVARYTRSKAAEAAAVAQQDRAVLVGEMDGVRAMTAQGAEREG